MYHSWPKRKTLGQSTGFRSSPRTTIPYLNGVLTSWYTCFIVSSETGRDGLLADRTAGRSSASEIEQEASAARNSKGIAEGFMVAGSQSAYGRHPLHARAGQSTNSEVPASLTALNTRMLTMRRLALRRKASGAEHGRRHSAFPAWACAGQRACSSAPCDRFPMARHNAAADGFGCSEPPTLVTLMSRPLFS
jgi:hypothetical protein